MRCPPHVHPVTFGSVRCVMAEKRLEEIEPQAYGLLVKFSKHNELRTGEGRLAERTGLATPQRAGGTG